jgi:hypothetical protein
MVAHIGVRVSKRSDSTILQLLKRDLSQREEELELMSDEDIQPVLEGIAIRTKLLADTRMAPVWSHLEGLAGWSFGKAEKLLQTVVRAQEDFKGQFPRTPGERAELLEEIASKASALQKLVNSAKADIVEADFAAIVDCWDWRSLDRSVRKSKSADLNSAGINYVRRWLKGKAGHLPFQPTFSDALEELARLANQRKANAPVLKQPNRENAAAYFIATRVRELFLSSVGGPRNNDAAVIASVATGVDIEGSNLARLVKTEN